MYQVIFASQYKKSLKKISKSGNFPINEIGELFGYRECHIKGDLLLIYKIEKENLILILVDIGSHSQLF